MLAVALCALLAQDPAPATLLSRARAFLVSAQEADGSFAPNRFGARYRRGVTALCVLALHGSEDQTHGAAARKAAGWLARSETITSLYGHAYATRALCVAAQRWNDLRGAAERAVAKLRGRQGEHGGWSYPGGERAETCLAAAMLQALHAARALGLTVPERDVECGLAFVRRRYVGRLRTFHNEETPSPSYGATAMAVAALGAWSQGDAKEAKGGLVWLRQQSIAKVTADLRGRPFKGYLRGTFHYELQAHAAALRACEVPERRDAWLAKLHAALAKQQAKDGSFDGWFGKAYGTALVVLAME